MSNKPTQAKYITRIRKSLEAVARYTPAMDIQIMTLASTLLTLETVTADIAALDSDERWCGATLKAHPAFNVQRYAWDSVTRQMKALGLTFAELGEETREEDPLVDLTRQLKDLDGGGSDAPIRPR